MIFSCLILTLSLLISILTLSYGQKDLQSTATTGLSTSMISTSSNSIPYAERQALSDIHDITDGSKRNYVSSSAGAQRSFNHPPENPWANQAVSHVKGIL